MYQSKIILPSYLSELEKTLHSQKKKIVFTVGTFDLIHSGHGHYLAMAKTYGDVLVVGVANNSSRKKLKGENSLLLDENIRAELVSFLKSVDYVVVVNDSNLISELSLLKPDVFFTVKDDWSKKMTFDPSHPRSMREKKIVEKYKGKVVKVAPVKPYISSLKLVDKIALLRIKALLESTYKDTVKVHVDINNICENSRPFYKNILYLEKRYPEKLLEYIYMGKNIAEDSLKTLGSSLRKENKRIVFTAGSWDLLHVGHARYLAKAKTYGDILVVGVASNEWIKRLKGKGRPIMDENARADVLCFLEPVDYVVIFNQKTVKETLQKLKPHVFYTVKESWNKGYRKSPEYALVKGYGGRVITVERQAPFISASSLIDMAAANKVRSVFSSSLEKSFVGEIVQTKEWQKYLSNYKDYNADLQKRARKTGEYDLVLKALEKCPFCDLKEKYFVKELSKVVLTVALFPYIDGHMLIIPKRHVEKIKDLKKEEWQQVRELFEYGVKRLSEVLKIRNVNFLYREGKNSGKSVGHLHFHLIPYKNEVITRNLQEITKTPLEMAQNLA